MLIGQSSAKGRWVSATWRIHSKGICADTSIGHWDIKVCKVKPEKVLKIFLVDNQSIVIDFNSKLKPDLTNVCKYQKYTLFFKITIFLLATHLY